MPEFILDTSGQVDPPASAKLWPHPLRWAQLSELTQGYIEALFFTESEPSRSRHERVTTRGTVRKSWERDVSEGQIKDMPGDYGYSDLASETLNSILRDCQEFERSPAWKAYVEYRDEANGNDPDCPDDMQAGRDFWFNRNGHGVGFWDGDWPEPHASALDKLAESFREVDVYIGDDEKVYLS